MKDTMLILFFVLVGLIAAAGHERWQAIQLQQDYVQDDVR